jgi:hypothetical protein
VWRASLQHGQLVAQDEDLDLLAGVGSGAQHHPAQELGGHQVDQLQRHGRIMSGTLSRGFGRSTGASRVSGTHRLKTLQKQYPKNHYFGNDISPQVIENNKGKKSPNKWSVEDFARKTTYQSEQFDIDTTLLGG